MGLQLIQFIHHLSNENTFIDNTKIQRSDSNNATIMTKLSVKVQTTDQSKYCQLMAPTNDNYYTSVQTQSENSIIRFRNTPNIPSFQCLNQDERI